MSLFFDRNIGFIAYITKEVIAALDINQKESHIGKMYFGEW